MSARNTRQDSSPGGRDFPADAVGVGLDAAGYRTEQGARQSWLEGELADARERVRWLEGELNDLREKWRIQSAGLVGELARNVALSAERDEALKEAEFYEIECSAARQEIDDAKADAAALREAGRRWLSETGPGQHTNTAVGRHMMIVAIGEVLEEVRKDAPEVDDDD